MRGEYKTPGGKLVAAELEVRDGVLADVRVTGDFFLEPAEALEGISASLEGAPPDASETELAERVKTSLGPEVEMVGFSPEAVAIAVRRALS